MGGGGVRGGAEVGRVEGDKPKRQVLRSEVKMAVVLGLDPRIQVPLSPTPFLDSCLHGNDDAQMSFSNVQLFLVLGFRFV